MTTLDANIPQGFTHDVAFVVQNWGANIQATASSSEPLPRSPLEDWMVSKLASVAEEGGYLASLSFGVGTRLIETVGATIIHGKKFSYRHFTDRDWLDAGREGFRVVAGGEDSIRQHLATLHHQFHPTRAFGGVALFGNLYSRLFLAKDPDYDAVRSLIRDYVIDNFPLGPGDQLFGEIKRRRWHSITSASKEYGIRPVALRRLLRENSLIGQEKAELNDHSVLFDAASTEHLLRRQSQTLTRLEAQEYIGANRVQWRILVRLGMIKPTMLRPKSKQAAFVREDLDKLLASLVYSTGIGDLEAMCNIPDTTKKARVKTDEIFKLLSGRALDEVTLAPNQFGLASVLINPREVKLRGGSGTNLTLWEASRRMGLRCDEASALVKIGFIPLQSQKRGMHFRPEDVDAFSAKFLSAPQVAEIVGKTRRGKASHTVVAMLNHLGIHPAISRSEVGLDFFERAAVEVARGRLESAFASVRRTKIKSLIAALG